MTADVGREVCDSGLFACSTSMPCSRATASASSRRPSLISRLTCWARAQRGDSRNLKPSTRITTAVRPELMAAPAVVRIIAFLRPSMSISGPTARATAKVPIAT